MSIVSGLMARAVCKAVMCIITGYLSLFAGAPVGSARVSSVTMTTRDNVQIVGSLFLPAREKADSTAVHAARLPGVILLHMWMRNRHEWDSLAGLLQARGFAVLSIDMRGHGESQPHRPEPSPGYYTEYMLDDGIAAYDFLLSQPGIDSGRIALVGASIGTTNAIRLCEYVNRKNRRQPIVSMALLSPASNYFGVYVGDCLPRCRKTPILFMLAVDDPHPGKTAIYKSGNTLYAGFKGEKRLLVHQGEGHGTNLLQLEGNTDSLVAWLTAHGFKDTSSRETAP
jgi:pimeloyl-ACP methyl ester carboxylesterase